MTAREADSAILKLMHETIKVARSVPDDTTRTNLLAKLVELDRLHGISLAVRHDEAIRPGSCGKRMRGC